MENEYTKTKVEDFVYTTLDETSSNQPAPSQPTIKPIVLFLALNTKTSTWIFDSNRNITQSGVSLVSGLIEKTITFDTEQVMEPAEMYRAISLELGGWQPLPEPVRQEVIGRISMGTRKMIKSMTPTHNPFSSACCQVFLRVDHFIHVSDVTDWIMQGSFEESVPSMVPASKSSIKALKRTIIVDGSCESCSVCLEDFPAGSEVLCMPCWHAFHQDCIHKWLSSSHFCPNCRYEMPVKK